MGIGVGDIGSGRVINQINADRERPGPGCLCSSFKLEGEEEITFGDESVTLLGLKGILTTMAKCCKPAPGDDIIAYITRGRGATIHRVDCPNVLRIRDRERLAKVTWGERKTTYPVAVRVRAYDRDGLMKDISIVISEENINIRHVSVDVNNNFAEFDLILEVSDIEELSRILTRLENLPNVMEARRVNPG